VTHAARRVAVSLLTLAADLTGALVLVVLVLGVFFSLLVRSYGAAAALTAAGIVVLALWRPASPFYSPSGLGLRALSAAAVFAFIVVGVADLYLALASLLGALWISTMDPGFPGREACMALLAIAAPVIGTALARRERPFAGLAVAAAPWSVEMLISFG
jgi:hypothetical protein